MHWAQCMQIVTSKAILWQPWCNFATPVSHLQVRLNANTFLLVFSVFPCIPCREVYSFQRTAIRVENTEKKSLTLFQNATTLLLNVPQTGFLSVSNFNTFWGTIINVLKHLTWQQSKWNVQKSWLALYTLSINFFRTGAYSGYVFYPFFRSICKKSV